MYVGYVYLYMLTFIMKKKANMYLKLITYKA